MIGRELLKYPEQLTAYLRRLEDRIRVLEREVERLKKKEASDG